MTINFDTITNNYEVIYVIKTVMKYHLKKIDTSFHQPLPNHTSTCTRRPQPMTEGFNLS
jgi:hypothetical protein